MSEQTQNITTAQTIGNFLDEWFFFTFSSKFRFALKISLAMMLAFIIPIYMGWTQVGTAGITIMLIASAGGASESLSKGLVRIIGTVVGAIIGLTLIALFPQDRLIYLTLLSLCVGVIIYLYYAHQGDSTVYMLTAMVMMMVFISGPENAFLYGVDRTLMTIFGIVVYTIVQVYIWPVKKADIDEKSLDSKKKFNFVWLYPEHIKATLQLLFVFWSTTAFWILFNPPGGFLLVTLATLLGLFTTFNPLKPIILVILLSIGFFFATISYVFILPNLVYGWELGLFIFFYTFVAFYFVKAKASIFFLVGMFLLGIDNTMSYNFDIFLNILLVFYMFLIILMFFRNFPFSSKPEHLFVKAKDNFLRHAKAITLLEKKSKRSYLQNIELAYHQQNLFLSSANLKLWGSKIDYDYFNITKEQIEEFSNACEDFKQTLSLDAYTNNTINWDSLKVSRY